MGKSIFLTLFIAVSIGLMGIGTDIAKAAGKVSNGFFEIIKIGPDSVQFKVVKEAKLYSVILMAGKQTFKANALSSKAGKSSNSEDVIKWANGNTFVVGSDLPMPSEMGVGPMTLPKGAILTVREFQSPKNFKAEKIKFLTEKGAAPMVYDIATSGWEKI